MKNCTNRFILVKHDISNAEKEYAKKLCMCKLCWQFILRIMKRLNGANYAGSSNHMLTKNVISWCQLFWNQMLMVKWLMQVVLGCDFFVLFQVLMIK